MFFRNGNKTFRLICSTTGQNSALFLDRYQEPKSQNTATFFSEIEGCTLESIDLANRDRYVTFNFDQDHKLHFILYSNQANVLLEGKGIVQESFKRNQEYEGKPAPLPEPAPFSISGSSGINGIVQKIEPLLPKPLIKTLVNSQSFDNENQIESFVAEIKESLLSGCHPHFSDVYGFSILNPEKYGVGTIRNFDSANEGVAFAVFQWIRERDFVSRHNEIKLRIEKSTGKLISSLAELKNSGLSLQRAESYEKYGHILMAHPQVAVNDTEIELPDYFDQGNMVKISVDPLLNTVENATSYYQKSKNARKSYEVSKVRLKELEGMLEDQRSLQNELNLIKHNRDLERWIRTNNRFLRKIGLNLNQGDRQQASFREVTLGGYTVSIGRSATNNDELLRISHKEDIWLHARGVSGSHVVIHMNRSRDLPPDFIIESAAEIAAFFSKAKGSSLVPVIFTKRKYVRKSKGMAPGAVLVDKEQVVLVAPREPGIYNQYA